MLTVIAGPDTLITYDHDGPVKTYNMQYFFTETAIPGCLETCSLGDTCGGTLSTIDNRVIFDGISPWTITAITTVIEGHSKEVCMRCTSNTGLNFDNTFTIVHSDLDCSKAFT